MRIVKLGTYPSTTGTRRTTPRHTRVHPSQAQKYTPIQTKRTEMCILQQRRNQMNHHSHQTFVCDSISYAALSANTTVSCICEYVQGGLE